MRFWSILILAMCVGKRIWSQKLPASVKCLEPMDIPSRGAQFTAVALENRQVLVFNDKHVVDCFRFTLILNLTKLKGL